MTEPNREFVEQISKKIEAGDADGATYLAFVVLTQVVPVLEQIAAAISPDADGQSVSERIREISSFCQNELKPLIRQIISKEGKQP